jgi:hypothetical protein
MTFPLCLLGKSLRQTWGEPPPDVVSGENVTLPSSFIALHREAITTIIFYSFFLVSLLLFRFSFCSIFILQKVISGPTHGFWPHAFSSWSHPPRHQSQFKTCFIFSISLSRARYGVRDGQSLFPFSLSFFSL